MKLLTKTKQILFVVLIALLFGFAPSFGQVEVWLDSADNITEIIDSMAIEYDGKKIIMTTGEFYMPDSYRYLIAIGETNLAEQMLDFYKPRYFKIKIVGANSK